MKLTLIIGSIIFPIIMVVVQAKWEKLHVLFLVTAIISALIFGNIASISIYEIIKNDNVFMTTIHGIFLNPLFLLTGSYLAVFLIYSLLYWTRKSL